MRDTNNSIAETLSSPPLSWIEGSTTAGFFAEFTEFADIIL